MSKSLTSEASETLDDFYDDDQRNENKTLAIQHEIEQSNPVKVAATTESLDNVRIGRLNNEDTTNTDYFDETNTIYVPYGNDGSTTELRISGTPNSVESDDGESPVLKDIVIIQMESESPKLNKIPRVVQVYDYDDGNNSDVDNINEYEEYGNCEEDDDVYEDGYDSENSDIVEYDEDGNVIENSNDVDNGEDSEVVGGDDNSEDAIENGHVKDGYGCEDYCDLEYIIENDEVNKDRNEVNDDDEYGSDVEREFVSNSEVAERVRFPRAPSCASMQNDVGDDDAEYYNSEDDDVDDSHYGNQSAAINDTNADETEYTNSEVNNDEVDDADQVDDGRNDDQDDDVESNDTGDDVESNDVDDDEDEEDDNEEEVLDDNSDTPYEGRFDVETPSTTRLTRLNCALYSTDGENLSGVRVSRSYAKKNRAEVVSAGATTVGELMATLKRKRAAEARNEVENSPNQQTPASILIQKRNEENEKLKWKGKERVLKSTVPCVDKEEMSEPRKVETALTNSMQGSRAERIHHENCHRLPISSIQNMLPNNTTVVGDHDPAHNANHIPTPDADDRVSHDVYSTDIDETPTNRNTASGIRTICSGVVSGLSDTSGRKNPQAKCDNEIRSGKSRLQVILAPSGISRLPLTGGRVNLCNGQMPILPAIRHTNAASKPVVSTTTKQVTDQRYKPSEQISRRVHDVKPPIPHQLRSAACYHDGNVDVSIIGDKRLLGIDDPLNVKITFVHKASPVVKTVTVNESPKSQKQKTSSENQRIASGITKHTASSNGHEYRRPTKGVQRCNIGKITAKIAKPNTILPPLKGVPKFYRQTTTNNDKIQTNNRTNNKIKKKENRSNKFGKQRVNKNSKSAKTVSDGFDYLNWDIVCERAQRPPFNTYTDPEASARHQRLFKEI